MKRLLLVWAAALVLPAAAVPVRGVVKQIDGLPAVGASVRCYREGRPYTFDWSKAVASVADNSGAFALDLQPGTWRVELDGAASMTCQMLRVEAGQPLMLRLGVDWPWPTPPRALLPVRLVGRDGRPAARRPVSLTLAGRVEHLPPGHGLGLAAGGWTHSWGMWPTGDDAVSAMTDEVGRAVFMLPPGSVTLGLQGRGVRQVDACLARPGVTLPERTLVVGDEPPARLAVAGPAPFDNWVRILGPDGAPLANRWVQLRRLEYEDCFAAHTDALGMARVRGFSDEARFVAKAPGFAESEPQWLVHRREQGAPTFRLTQRARTLAGVVRDPAGAPLAGCRVFVCRPEARGRDDEAGERDWCLTRLRRGFVEGGSECAPREPQPASLASWLARGTFYAETAADGTYRFADLDPGRWHVVFVRPGSVTEEVRAVPLDGRLDQVLRPDANVLRAQVLDTDGRPWANRAVTVDVRPLPGPFASRADWDARAVVLTDEAGWFRLGPEVLPACTSSVTVTAGARTAALKAVALSSHGPSEVTLILSPELVIAGRVLLPDGRPAAQAWVRHLDSVDVPGAAPPSTAWTDDTGQFRLLEPGPGQVDLVIAAEGCASARVRADSAAKAPLAVRLASGATLRGPITKPREAGRYGIYRIACRVEGEAWPILPNWRDGVGLYGFDTYALAGLPLGRVHLSAAPSEEEYGEVTVTLPSEQPVPLRVELLGRGTVSGVVRGHDGRPRAGVTVEISPFRGTFARQVTRAEGRFRFDSVIAGDYSLEFNADDEWLASRPGRLSAGAEARVEVRVPLTVSGQISGLPAGWSAAVAMTGLARWQDLARATAHLPESLRWTVPLWAAARPVENGAYRAQVEGAGGQVHAAVIATRHDAEAGRLTELVWVLGQRSVPSSGRPLDLPLPARRARLAVDVSGSGLRDGRRATAILLTDLGTRLPVGSGELRADGSLEWPSLPAGRCRVLACLDGRACPVREIDLADGQTRLLAVRPCTGVAVSGPQPAGEPGVEVVLSNAAVYGVARTRPDGVWRIDGVPPGTYQLWTLSGNGVTTKDVVVGTEPVTVAAAEPGAVAKGRAP